MTIEKRPVMFGTPAERSYGYAQAVKAGDTIYISGQVALTARGAISGVGDMRAQMREAYAGVERVLAEYGADMSHVVDEVLYVTDVAAASAVAGDVRREVYGGTFELASTLLQVAALAAPDLLIEIRCTAKA